MARLTERTALWSALGAGLAQLQSILLFLWCAHRLSGPDLGSFRLVGLLVLLLALLGAAGAPEALLHGLGHANSPRERKRCFLAAGLWLVLSAAPIGLVVTAAVPLLGWFQGRSFPAAEWGAAGWLALCSAVLPYFGPVFQSAFGARWYCVGAGCQLLVLLVATEWLLPSGSGLGRAWLIASLPGALGWGLLALALALAAARPRPLLREVWRDCRERALPYGLPLALGAFLYLLAYQVDHLVASRLLSPAEYGVYVLGAWQLPVGTLLQVSQRQSHLTALSEMLARRRTEEFHRVWTRQVRAGFAWGALLFWGVFLAAEELLVALVGQPGRAAVPVFRVYSSLLCVQMTALCLPLWAAGNTRADARAAVLFLAVSAGIGTVLTEPLGRLGPALGVVTGLLVWSAVLVGAASRKLGLTFLSLVPLHRLGVALAVFAAPAWGAAWAADRLPLRDGGGWLVAFGALYGLLAWPSLALLSRGEDRPERSPAGCRRNESGT